MNAKVTRVVLPLVFPAGLAPGAGKESNRLTLARDGANRYVLRGTSIAGALRHAWARLHGVGSDDAAVTAWFGAACDAGGGDPSPLRIADALLDIGPRRESELRTFVARSRHTGAAVVGSLFDLEALPPGASTTVVLELHSHGDEDTATFVAEIVGLITAGLLFGGHGARGLGQARLESTAIARTFNLSDVGEHALWLDEVFARRRGKLPTDGHIIEPKIPSAGPLLQVHVTFTVPRGQDFVVGDGQGMDVEVEPQRVVTAKGKEKLRLPGSTLRGALRSWVARLAAREGLAVVDSAARYVAQGDARGDDLAWGFASKEDRKHVLNALSEEPSRLREEIACPVMRLFGSSFSAGRIHVSDAIGDGTTQTRTHVGVDRLTGGANEGFLFDAEVVCGARFETTILVWEPTEQESKWLAQSLRAIDLGLCRIGSSKAGGRLALAASPTASGAHASLFQNLEPCEA
jgi:CRISPR/Cas system CSM-associated protein Csm3 (group 7 of RAMP superfamily)